MSFQYFKCVGWIVYTFCQLFENIESQYFKCVGWIFIYKAKWVSGDGFNTSNVSVEYAYRYKGCVQASSFNTSNVSVEYQEAGHFPAS